MSVLNQIKNDIEYHKMFVTYLHDPVNQTTRDYHASELNRLKLILESGVIPNRYHSTVTKRNYFPTEEEKRIRSKPFTVSNHCFFTIKESRKDTQKKMSRFFVMRDNLQLMTKFFIEHDQNKRYPSGGFADRVKKAYLQTTQKKPTYAIKIYKISSDNDEQLDQFRTAMRAAYCYRLLGREAFSFRKNYKRLIKQYMLTEWLPGVNLNEMSKKDMLLMPIEKRILMAIVLLRELSILHQVGFIHHDIKPDNVIIGEGKLRFVDLDSVTMKHESFPCGSTPIYTEAYLQTPKMSYIANTESSKMYKMFDEKSDIYAMGITLSYLFPEIYYVKQIKKTITINNNPEKTHSFDTIQMFRKKTTKLHPELHHLLKQMIYQTDTSPLTADACIDAFKHILISYPDGHKYLAKDKDPFAHSRENLSIKHGKEAFKNIDIELLRYHQREERFNNLQII